MKFCATVMGNSYTFEFINNSSVLVSGNNTEYILFKSRNWQCADQVEKKLLKNLGEAIDRLQQAAPQ